MISLLRGKVVQKYDSSITFDVNGVGYDLQVSSRTLSQIKEDVLLALHTYMHVREDALTLFGFCSRDEKELFLILIKISGIGPKLALSIMGMSNPEEFKRNVLKGDVDYFESIPGIGNRTANRIIVELKGKIAKETFKGEKLGVSSSEFVIGDALKALLSLGYSRSDAQKIVEGVIKSKGDQLPLDEFLKHALAKTK